MTTQELLDHGTIPPHRAQTNRPWTPQRAPFVAVWTDERAVLAKDLVLKRNGKGITWKDGETPQDRDRFGALWARLEGHQGAGTPVFDEMAPIRQRDCFLHRRCQVCRKPASQTDKGQLFLRTTDDPGPEKARVTQPPVCLPCAADSTRRCKHLRGRALAVRSKKPRLRTALGVAYSPLPDGILYAAGPVDVPLRDKARLRWVLVSHYEAELHQCTIVDLDEELKHHDAAA
ncbi:hypothetical protein ACFY0Z_30010 [Streptomyces kronopolitis]|uniref:hypothetical protein n=1 Tax=Streptomyces kronopolitis TaxID=1612435 RepID=UPI0036CF3C9B